MQFSGKLRSGSSKVRALLSALILLILLSVNNELYAAPILDSSSSTTARGDANGDGIIAFSDIPPFITALQSESIYRIQFPDLDPDVVLDMNNDGQHSFSDIPGFIDALVSGGQSPQAPSDLETVPSGSADSISLTWSDSSTENVTGYEVHYGLTAGNLTNVKEVGDVSSATISGLTAGQTWHVAVVAVASGRKSSAAAATITAQADAAINIVPLFNSATPLEPAITVDTPAALTTYLSDRARDRHAREAMFNAYDHYLSWYWEQRMMNVEIIDRVGRNGGTDITFNYTTQRRLNPAEFRTFFRGITTLAEYSHNQIATLVSTNPSVTTLGETDFNYSATISQNTQLNRPIREGDRIEVEISQFLQAPRNGRSNYYGTTLLYIVGEGIVPWGQGNDLGFNGGVVGNVLQRLDSYPLPTNAWLGGKTTVHYQYSDEPDNAFKQTAANLSPTNGYDFMLGRRLHHTDFGDGTHSESGNPVFAAQVGKLGSKYIARSCVECHVNNGRALPPAIGELMTSSSLRVGIDSRGTPHPVLGSVFQPKSTSGGGTPSIEGADVTILDFGSTGNGTHAAYTETILGGAASDPAPIVADAPGGGTDATFALSDGASIAWTNVTTWNNNADGGNAGENYFAATGSNVVSFEITTANPDDTVLVEAVAGFERDAIVGYGDTAPSTVETYAAGNSGWTTVGSSVGTSTGTLARGTAGDEGNVGAFRITIIPSAVPEPPSDSNASDGSATISSYRTITGHYGDGTPFTLRKPTYTFGGTTPSHYSVRLAPPLIGMGLLEAISESSIMALADPDDSDDDGISGRPQIVIDPETGQPRLGRFGYKGSHALVAHQIAGALNGDIGITTSVFPVLDDGTTGGGSGISDAELDLMTRYTALLGVQARRNLDDAQALRGETLFASAGCAKCHTPQFTTSSTHPMAELRGQTISPYSDLLLHDMGPGLADNMGEGIAGGSEWRTSALWNLGHTAGVAETGEAYLHDGRAETLEEAILWHGGEADASKDAFCNMSEADRAAMIAFLKSL